MRGFFYAMFQVPSYEELISSLFALIGVWLTIRRSAWCWAALSVSTILFGIVTLRGKLYADTMLQVIYLTASLYGAWQWRRQALLPESTAEFEISTLNLQGWIWSIIATFVLGFGLGYGLDFYSDADIPYYDSLCFAGSVTAQILQAKKKIENWLWWIIADTAYCLIYWYKGYYSFVILFIILTVMAVIGYRSWQQTRVTLHSP